MFKVSKLNPKDTTLDRIHIIQKEIAKETEKLSVTQKTEYFNKIAKDFDKKYKCNLKFISFKKLHS